MRKLFTILLLTGSFFTAFSQEKGKFELGFNVGYNLSTAQAGSETNSDFRSGVNIGAFGNYFFSDSWSIKAKVSYDQKGWDNGFITNLDNGQSYKTNYRFDYITVPVTANWHFGRTKNWYLNFGPYAGFLLSAKETTLNTDFKKYSNNVDLGLALGIGVKIPIANRVKVLLEADGQSGVTDIFKNNQGSTIRNSRSGLNAGLIFDL